MFKKVLYIFICLLLFFNSYALVQINSCHGTSYCLCHNKYKNVESSHCLKPETHEIHFSGCHTFQIIQINDTNNSEKNLTVNTDNTNCKNCIDNKNTKYTLSDIEYNPITETYFFSIEIAINKIDKNIISFKDNNHNINHIESIKTIRLIC